MNTPAAVVSFAEVLAGAHPSVILVLDFHGTVSAPDPQWPGECRRRDVQTSFGTFPVVWASGLRDELHRLSEDARVQLVWSTSWGPEITRIEDLFGLPRQPRAIDNVLPHEEVPAAKRAVIDRVASTGIPFVWCDDREAVEGASAGTSLTIRPRSRHGLTLADFERIKQFVSTAAARLHSVPVRNP